ncbi:MAG: hypothetical protein CVU79_02035 [Elusimicrobia bacterium HGW-Elusimicrobia-3]|nr:MAG: hypothetical protein CVU79_02035 [Elusimicrobia bacterium HGW-Elusimicrobia-3]
MQTNTIQRRAAPISTFSLHRRAAASARRAARAAKTGRGQVRIRFDCFLEMATLLCRIYSRLK